MNERIWIVYFMAGTVSAYAFTVGWWIGLGVTIIVLAVALALADKLTPGEELDLMIERRGRIPDVEEFGTSSLIVEERYVTEWRRV